MMPKPTDQELENRFRYHKPDSDRLQRHTDVTELMLATAKAITAITPAGRGQAMALTKLEEARMWANMAIATATVPDESSR
jgi:hypothetical protein